jgi:hypothetical protein
VLCTAGSLAARVVGYKTAEMQAAKAAAEAAGNAAANKADRHTGSSSSGSQSPEKDCSFGRNSSSRGKKRAALSGEQQQQQQVEDGEPVPNKRLRRSTARAAAAAAAATALVPAAGAAVEGAHNKQQSVLLPAAAAEQESALSVVSGQLARGAVPFHVSTSTLSEYLSVLGYAHGFLEGISADVLLLGYYIFVRLWDRKDDLQLQQLPQGVGLAGHMRVVMTYSCWLAMRMQQVRVVLE